MKPILRSLTISTTVVVGYPIVVFAVLVSFAAFGLRPYQANAAFDTLLMPLNLPGFIMRTLYPSEHLIYGRMPIEQMVLVLGWFIAFNIVLYYIPIRLFLGWRDKARKLP
jgi:hypothetical protein